ncbi:hypothetical protein HPB48_002851 [Haemaphysalis longicornis]|uniref:CCHC-type domain-containing protein n=1 Tax=Haemaphysalis longicornis TaxID=44386 RepID=A0A9J6FXL6_HAELO|nr:hypothetical protein HPB48_002851 [Haemaphysalis longicornis]
MLPENPTPGSDSQHVANMDFDENSGRTMNSPGPWVQVLRERSNAKKNQRQAANIASTQQHAPSTSTTHSQASEKSTGAQAAHTSQPSSINPCKYPTQRPRKYILPKLPEDEYKIVYRPHTGLKVSAWPDKSIAQGLAVAGGFHIKDFYAHVTVQTQWTQNLIVASTADEDYAMKLSAITHLQLGAAQYELSPYLTPLPGTVRGVIHGIEAGTTEEDLADLISTTGPRILHARMLGRSTSALITFDGPHVPFYVKFGSTYTRCRPYRRSVQFCSACGELGHRQDVCPNPEKNVCKLCGDENPQPNHSCQPKCKLCDLPHETAGKDCKKRLRPSPPPLHIRERFIRYPEYSGDTSVQCPPAQETRSTLPQDNTKVSWSQVLKHPPTAPNPFPPLPDRSSNTNTQHYEQTISTLRSQNTELTKRLELIEKAAQSRIEALERQIEQLITRIETSQSSSATLRPLQQDAPPPTPDAPQVPALPTFEQLNLMIEQKIDQKLTQFKEQEEQHLTSHLENVHKALENTTHTIMKLGETLNARMTRLEEALNDKVDKMGLNLNQRVISLEEEHQQSHKKPKSHPLREAHMQETGELPDND